ncbi:hypothetical protein [Thiobacillus sp.]|uniref:hypothetical protein n=1 Tax=Thiobacillus sp. TaxID=924 RepID=UPI0017C82549|nr:hypothetical protein [Thiobacillus sp.]MBC2729973.1 hypothetical protein [Thiobacillus sp.]MBC2738710.1 hypothetical protein [Thiobacillus sp.]MBC2760997.1 hypothetical protein [Thiobacillus sp.]
MKAIFRINRALLDEIHSDLNRRHPFAVERVGFIACGAAALPDGYLLLAQSYHPVADEHYEEDLLVGAMMGSNAIRKSLQLAYQEPVSMFHVHRHEHRGKPHFSRVDVQESARFVPDFWKVRPNKPHGAIVLSHDSMSGAWWNPESKKAQSFAEMAVIGRPTFTYREEAWTLADRVSLAPTAMM